MNIDADTHYIPPALFNKGPSSSSTQIGKSPDKNLEQFTSPKLRIDAMKEAGFDKSCLLMQGTTIPDPYIDRDRSIAVCRIWNDETAKVVNQYDEFIGVAQVSHQDVDAAIEEADRATKDLGFKAIQVVGSWGGKASLNMEHPDWWPFFQKVEQLGVPLWFHTSGNYGYQRANTSLPGQERLRRLPPNIGVLLGFLWHTQLVVAGLIFAGIPERFPALRVVLTECDAGWVPSFMDWLDTIYFSYLENKSAGTIGMWYDDEQFDYIKDLRMKRKPSAYVKQAFYFSLISTTGHSIDQVIPWLVNEVGFRNLVIESDYPHPEGTLDIVRRVRELDGIDEAMKDRICGGNAAELLKIRWAPSAYAV